MNLPPSLRQSLEELVAAVGKAEATEIVQVAAAKIGHTGTVADWIQAMGDELARREPKAAQIAGWPKA